MGSPGVDRRHRSFTLTLLRRTARQVRITTNTFRREDTTEKIKPFKPKSGWQYTRFGDSRMEDPDGDYGYDGDRGR